MSSLFLLLIAKRTPSEGYTPVPAEYDLSLAQRLKLQIEYYLTSDSTAAFRLAEHYYWNSELWQSCQWFARAQKSDLIAINTDIEFYTKLCGSVQP